MEALAAMVITISFFVFTYKMIELMTREQKDNDNDK